jgi:methionine-S-sulfoxide reductase
MRKLDSCLHMRTIYRIHLIVKVCAPVTFKTNQNRVHSFTYTFVTNNHFLLVCNGDTGHVEVLHVELSNPSYFEDLIKFFFLFHDPTTKDRQGNDRGTQYASAIFVSDDEQRRIAHKVIQDLQSAIDSGKISPYTGKKIVTDVHQATRFYAAEDYHQGVSCII